MATFKDIEDSLKTFIIQEQSDAHNIKNVNNAKYNNIKITTPEDILIGEVLLKGLEAL